MKDMVWQAWTKWWTWEARTTGYWTEKGDDVTGMKCAFTHDEGEDPCCSDRIELMEQKPVKMVTDTWLCKGANFFLPYKTTKHYRNKISRVEECRLFQIKCATRTLLNMSFEIPRVSERRWNTGAHGCCDLWELTSPIITSLGLVVSNQHLKNGINHIVHCDNEARNWQQSIESHDLIC